MTIASWQVLTVSMIVRIFLYILKLPETVDVECVIGTLKRTSLGSVRDAYDCRIADF